MKFLRDVDPMLLVTAVAVLLIFASCLRFNSAAVNLGAIRATRAKNCRVT